MKNMAFGKTIRLSCAWVFHYLILQQISRNQAKATDAQFPIFTTGMSIKTIKEEEMNKIINPRFNEDQDVPVFIDSTKWTSMWFQPNQTKLEDIDIYGINGRYHWSESFKIPLGDDPYVLTFTNDPNTRETVIHEMCNERVVRKPFANQMEVGTNNSYKVLDSETFFAYCLRNNHSLILQLDGSNRYENAIISFLVEDQSNCKRLTLGIEAGDLREKTDVNLDRWTDKCKPSKEVKIWKRIEHGYGLFYKKVNELILTSSSGDCNIANINIKYRNNRILGVKHSFVLPYKDHIRRHEGLTITNRNRSQQNNVPSYPIMIFISILTYLCTQIK